MSLTVWLRRLARVESRVGQAWTLNNGDIVLVVGKPALAVEWKGTLVDVITAANRVGWCHEVFNVHSNTRFSMNETWFLNKLFGRVA